MPLRIQSNRLFPVLRTGYGCRGFENPGRGSLSIADRGEVSLDQINSFESKLFELVRRTNCSQANSWAPIIITTPQRAMNLALRPQSDHIQITNQSIWSSPLAGFEKKRLMEGAPTAASAPFSGSRMLHLSSESKVLRPSPKVLSLSSTDCFAESSKRPRFKPGGSNSFKTTETSKNPNLFCLISLKRTKNNTHALISNLFGEKKTLWSISAGLLKLPGGRRKTKLSQRMVYKSCLEKALSFGYKYTVIHCRGTRGSKLPIFRFFGAPALSVLLIKDTTGTAHNGCRPPKMRRV